MARRGSPTLFPSSRDDRARGGRSVRERGVGLGNRHEGPLGQAPQAGFLTAELASILHQQGFQTPTITLEHALLAGKLPGPHKDPFDRMLIAQSRIEGLPVVTRDPAFAPYGVETIW